tara:strand:+ start:4239 stop:4829 length:591 start_codon:yes stop_codon:yes gene_type:complete
MTQHVRNILKVYRRATTDDIANGIEWYDRAKRYAELISEETRLHLNTVIGVMAALSPNNKWERNVIDCQRMCNAWLNGEGLDDFKVSCYNNMKQKAWSILDDILTSDDDILTRLNGQKIRSFYSNIRGLDEVTIDGHALNIALGKVQGLTTYKTNMSTKVYKQMQQVYIRAAKRVDIEPHVLQAITWTTWKREHNI